MKNIFYKILPVCLLVMGLVGCEDDTKYSSLPEAVPLTMKINDKAFVMGEHLVVDFAVNPDEDGNEVMANEEFDIYFTAKSGTEDASDVFEDFHRVVTFPKGEKNIHVDFPIKESGLSGSKNLEFVAFVRGYKVANSSQSIKVSDYYRVTMTLENNTENIVTEGDKFILVATLDKPKAVPVEVTVTPEEGEESFFEDLPSTLTILPGTTSIKSSAVTIKPDGQMTGDKDLTLNFESSSPSNPMTSPNLVIKMTDIESLADPDLYDPTKVYANPAQMFVSPKYTGNVWFASNPVMDMAVGTAHPYETLAAAGWKFNYATEFHHIGPSGGDFYTTDAATGHDYLASPVNGMNDVTDNTSDQAKVSTNNKVCSNVNDDGELSLWACRASSGSAPYSVGGYTSLKVNLNVFKPNYTLIYPGMRIELKVRLGGTRTGFIPTISIRESAQASHQDTRTIMILKNVKGTAITQSVGGGGTGMFNPGTDLKTVTTSIPKAEDWNIYWVEWLSDGNVKVGINGSTTLTLTPEDMADWQFKYTKAETTSIANANFTGNRGMYIVMRMAPSPELLSGTLPAGWDANLGAGDFETKGPRMDIDWIRYYTNDNYNRLATEKVNSAGQYY